MNDVAIEKQICVAAEETLRAWPEAKAAILFGSRARGDHRPDSDWDIVFITRTADRVPGDVPLDALGDRFHVQVLALPEGVVRRKCNAPGHIAYHIARQGRVVAGRWNKPATEDNPDMNTLEFQGWMDGSLTHLVTAATQLNLAADQGGEKEAQLFVAASAQAAEHLVKAMLYRRGCEFPWTHDLNRLAGILPDQRLRARAEGLDGAGARHHMADYLGINAADSEIAGRRCCRVAELWKEEIEIALQDPELSTGADLLARKLIARAGRLTDPLRTGGMGAIPEDEAVAAALAQRSEVAAALDVAASSLAALLSERDRDTTTTGTATGA